MQSEPLNTFPIQQFLQKVKVADASNAKEIKFTTAEAKALAFTLGIVMTRLEGDLERLIASYSRGDDEVIQINMDGGGGNWK
ncbi:MAG: hypothetical protein ACKVJK_03235 [Methylophagaceae bacterium]|jgi:hypothetical protein|tara:strand:+ start:766 stop:1011 length:246 start_codon:yes stop_codon:yes gene_type:complete